MKDCLDDIFIVSLFLLFSEFILKTTSEEKDLQKCDIFTKMILNFTYMAKIYFSNNRVGI